MGKSVERHDALELLAPVTFNCVCFRLTGVAEQVNRAAVRRLVNDGHAMLGPVKVKGSFGLRACFMNLWTTEQDIDFILDRVVSTASVR